MTELQELRDEVKRIDVKVERILCQLEPISNLYAGNGKKSLEARVSVAENDIADSKDSTRWAMRTAVTAILGALSSVVLYLLKK